MRPLPLLVAAGALGIAAVAPAAALAWGQPQRASTGPGDAHSPDVAVDGRGAALAAWVQERGGRGTIVASAAPDGRPWSPPRRLSPPGLAAIDPAVAGLPGGGAVVVWRQADRTRTLRGRRQAVYVVRARERGADGRWGAVRRLSDARQKVGEPRLAVDARGTAIATWHWGTGTRAGTPGHIGEIQVAEKPAGAPWSRARRAAPARDCRLDTRLPDVAAGGAGQAVVWWQCDRPGGRSAARAIARGPSPASWGAAAGLPFARSGDQASAIAVDPAGTAVALAAGAGGALAAFRGAAPLGTPRGLELTPVALPAPQAIVAGAGRPALAPAPAGALGAWPAAAGLALADIAAPQTVALAVLPGRPRPRAGAAVAATGRGWAVAVAAANGGAVGTARGPGGEWAPLARISAPGPAEDTVVDATERVGTAYWSRRAGARRVVERAELRLGP